MTKIKKLLTAKEVGFTIPPFVDESDHNRKSCLVIRGIVPIDAPDTVYDKDHKVTSPDPIERVLHEVKDRFFEKHGISVMYHVNRSEEAEEINISFFLSWTGDNLESINQDETERKVTDMVYHAWVSRFRCEAVQALNNFFDKNFTPLKDVPKTWEKLAEKEKAKHKK